ncbi:hypothetical protein CP985_04415 [Malaciobacter mytili LMG 24559]|uniref:Uncharacterized protein n=1 Tax=Malaciobacter mytili LMG 24559 TaxID=1032238 RepID=A0AAX2AHP1_9BACT|nr:hypothetical protein [Malaciobacter mytili]AXH14677.1 hypothetical protein AMYT_1089 [Malaciobacter mytili LMG 24559]RXK16229.1 hypothetical protein CP985_04415 [Malaciobacter mytili LMG 24559]
MKNKFTTILIIAFFSINLYAHNMAGFEMVLKPLKDDLLKIEAKMKNSSRKLYGNKVQLVSMVDNRVLLEGYLQEKKDLIVKIPKESYWVYIYIEDNDIVQEGPAPINGFKIIVQSQKNKAFKYCLYLSLLFLILAGFIAMKKIRVYKKLKNS